MISIDLLPVETLVNVFSLCSYMDLLSVSSVCRVWKTIMQSDPSLQVQTFKSTGDDIEGQASLTSPSPIRSIHTRVQIHPAIMKVSYRLGDELGTAGFPCGDTKAIPTRQPQPLSNFPVSTDFATIPVVKYMNLEVRRPLCMCCRPTVLSFIVSVQNMTGIRVLDVFSALAQESRMQCDLVYLASRGAFSQRLQPGQKRSTTVKADMLGRHR